MTPFDSSITRAGLRVCRLSLRTDRSSPNNTVGSTICDFCARVGRLCLNVRMIAFELQLVDDLSNCEIASLSSSHQMYFPIQKRKMNGRFACGHLNNAAFIVCKIRVLAGSLELDIFVIYFSRDEAHGCSNIVCVGQCLCGRACQLLFKEKTSVFFVPYSDIRSARPVLFLCYLLSHTAYKCLV